MNCHDAENGEKNLEVKSEKTEEILDKTIYRNKIDSRLYFMQLK